MGPRPAPHPRAGLRRRRRARRGRPAGARSPAPPTRTATTSCATSTSCGCASPTGSSGPRCSATRRTPTASPAPCAAVEDRVPYLRDLGVTYLHLMPLLTPRSGPNDGGYAVQDYRSVRPDLGDVDDLRAPRHDAARRGHQPVPGPRAQPRRARARLGGRGARGRRRPPRLLPRLRRPRAARRLRGDAAGGLPRLRARQLHLGRGARRLGLDDVQRLPVGRQLVEPRGAVRVRRDHPGAGQPGGGGLPARRHRVHLEAPRHGEPERARGARAHPRAPHGRPHRGPRRALQGRGDRGSRRPAGLPRRRRPRGSGQRPRLPQRADGPGLVDARVRRRAPRRPRAAAGAAAAVDHGVDDLRAVPRRHRMGDRRRGRPRRRHRPVRAPPLPVRLVLRGAPRLVGTGAGLPAERGDGRPADLRLAGLARRARGGGPAGDRPGSCWRTRSCSASAVCR